MTQLKKVAILLILIGKEKGQRVLELMDNDEIRAIIPELRKVTTVSTEMQTIIWDEFSALGFTKDMKAVDILDIIRFSFGGSKIKR